MKRHNQLRRGQMEIMGLMLIVIIAGLLFVFAVNFAGNGVAPDTSSRPAHEAFGERAVANNFVAVLKDTYVPECRADYETLVRDCANSAAGQRIICDGVDSCLHIEKIANKTLNKTLVVWGLDYEFSVRNTRTDGLLAESSSDGAPCRERESPGIAIIPLYPLGGDAMIRLDICKG